MCNLQYILEFIFLDYYSVLLWNKKCTYTNQNMVQNQLSVEFRAQFLEMESYDHAALLTAHACTIDNIRYLYCCLKSLHIWYLVPELSIFIITFYRKKSSFSILISTITSVWLFLATLLKVSSYVWNFSCNNILRSIRIQRTFEI